MDALVVSAATARDLPGLADVFASNLTYLKLAGGLPEGADVVPATVAADAVEQERRPPGGRALAIRAAQTGPVVGYAGLLVPNPADGLPWIGLLMIDGRQQGNGLGRQTADRLLALLAEEGWPAVRLGVLTGNPRAVSFWRSEGFVVQERRRDTEGRDCLVMERELAQSPGGVR